MARLRPIHVFEREGKYFAIDIANTFCFECDRITYDVLQYYPELTLNQIIHRLSDQYSVKEIEEVLGELEFLRCTGSILKHQKTEIFIKSLTTPPRLKSIVFFIQNPTNETFYNILSKVIFKAIDECSIENELHITFLITSPHLSFPEKVALASEAFQTLSNSTYRKIQFTLAIELTESESIELNIPHHDTKLFTIFNKVNEILLNKLSNMSLTDSILSNNLKVKNSISPTIKIIPFNSSFASAIEKLLSHGIRSIDIDVFAPLVLDPSNSIGEHYTALKELTTQYTEWLLKGTPLIVLKPIYDLFYRIRNGIPISRADPASGEEWFVTEGGEIYGGYLYYLAKIGRLKSLDISTNTDPIIQKIYNLSAETVGKCMRCWAKYLCGSGHGAVHYRFTKNYTQPYDPWCEAQQEWIEHIIAEYQKLNTAGIVLRNDIETVVPLQTKHSFLHAVKHTFSLLWKEKLFLRPIQPTDVEWRTQWETWNTHSYFTTFESNVLVTSQYEIEQEILEPKKNYEEFVIVDKKMQPRGLVRIKQDTIPNLFWVWIYLKNIREYQSKYIQQELFSLLQQTIEAKPNNKWLTTCAENETELIQFLEHIGFSRVGLFRDRVLIHDRYLSLHVFLWGRDTISTSFQSDSHLTKSAT